MPGMSHRVESEFVHFVVESLSSLGPVVAKRMFNGHGIFLNKVMFGIVAWDTLYLKVDDKTRSAYEEKGLEPFSYTDQSGRALTLPYYEAPTEAIEDPPLLHSWGRDAYQASLRTSESLQREDNRRRA